jgi:ribosomal protein L37AE/L43A
LMRRSEYTGPAAPVAGPSCASAMSAYKIRRMGLPATFFAAVVCGYFVRSGTTMYEPEVLVPVTCPRCGKESVKRLAVSVVAEALMAGTRLQLSSTCHAVEWQATRVELEQIREYLSAACIDWHDALPVNAAVDIRGPA